MVSKKLTDILENEKDKDDHDQISIEDQKEKNDDYTEAELARFQAMMGIKLQKIDAPESFISSRIKDRSEEDRMKDKLKYLQKGEESRR